LTVSIHQHWLRYWHPGDRYDGQIVEFCPGPAAVSGVDLQNEGLLLQPKGKGLSFEPALQPIEVGRGFSRSESTSHPVKSVIPARRKVKRHLIRHYWSPTACRVPMPERQRQGCPSVQLTPGIEQVVTHLVHSVDCHPSQ
jgi:hypothetical protein